MKNISVIALSLLLLLSGCNGKTYKGDVVRGTLVDAGSGAPIGDAYVAIYWNGWVAHPADSRNECLHVGIAKSDAEGKFLLPEWDSHKASVRDVSAVWFAYKPGYDLSIGGNSNAEGFRPKPNGTYAVKRLNDLRVWIQKMHERIPSGCGREDEKTFKAQIAFYDAVIDIVKSASESMGPINVYRDGDSFDALTEIRFVKCLTLSVRAQLSSSDPAVGSNRASEVYDKCTGEVSQMQSGA